MSNRRFTVVSNESIDADRMFDAKRKTLRRIRGATLSYRRGASSPRNGQAHAIGVLVLALVLGAASLVKNYLNLNVVMVVAAVLWGMTIFLVKRYSTQPLTHAAHLDALLADYDPVSKEAFKELQEHLRALGRFDVDSIDKWAADEAEAIQAASGQCMEAGGRFLQKRI
jgi:hypothetical protein